MTSPTEKLPTNSGVDQPTKRESVAQIETQDDVSTVDRNRSIADPRNSGRHFPAPASYEDENWQRDHMLFAQAPWFQADVIDNATVVPQYAIYGWLPGGVPLDIITTWSWRHEYACLDGDLHFRGRSWAEVRFDFNSRSMAGFERLRSWVQPHDDHSCICLHWTRGEIDYVASIVNIPSATINSWSGRHIVSDEAWVWNKAQLRAEIRYARKRGTYWRWVHDERRFRSKFGRVIRYQCVTVFAVKDAYLHKAFCELPTHWRSVEVPMGCAVKSAMVFSHRTRELMDPQSGWWVVAYTEFAVKTAAFVLMEVYDNFRLWVLSPDMIGAIRSLDLRRALGCVENVRECKTFLDIIETTDYESLPSAWKNRGTRFVESYSPGRRGPDADWVYFDPWTRRRIWREEAEGLMRESPRDIPDGHPVGWDFSIPPGGWRAPKVEVGVSEVVQPGVPSVLEHDIDTTKYASPEATDSDGDMEVIRGVSRRVGGIPDAVLAGSEDVIVGYLRGRLHR